MGCNPWAIIWRMLLYSEPVLLVNGLQCGTLYLMQYSKWDLTSPEENRTVSSHGLDFMPLLMPPSITLTFLQLLHTACSCSTCSKTCRFFSYVLLPNQVSLIPNFCFWFSVSNPGLYICLRKTSSCWYGPSDQAIQDHLNPFLDFWVVSKSSQLCVIWKYNKQLLYFIIQIIYKNYEQLRVMIE